MISRTRRQVKRFGGTSLRKSFDRHPGSGTETQSWPAGFEREAALETSRTLPHDSAIVQTLPT